MSTVAGHSRELTSAALVEEIPPTPEPWLAAQRLAALPHLLFLDSASGPDGLGRFSLVTADPFAWLTSRGRQVWLNGSLHTFSDPLTVLADTLDRFRTDPLPGLPPFQGGAAGLFGYDLCHHLERLPRPRFDEFQVPDLAFGF